MTKIIIICGPSASGKNTIINSLFSDNKYQYLAVITCTSRPKRPTDVDGQIYHFLSNTDFQEKTNSDFFLEYEQIHGFFYGTPKTTFSKNGIYLMQSDIRGALNIKKAYPKTLIIFINLPEEHIAKRLKDRGADQAEIKRRLQTAENEFAFKSQADVIVDNLDGKYSEALNKTKIAIDNFLRIV